MLDPNGLAINGYENLPILSITNVLTTLINKNSFIFFVLYISFAYLIVNTTH